MILMLRELSSYISQSIYYIMKLHKALFGALLVMANLSTQAQRVHNMVVQTNKVGARYNLQCTDF